MLFRISHMNARLSSLALLNIGSGEIILILAVLLVLAVLAVAIFGVICLIFGVARNQPPAAAPISPQEVLIENQLKQERLKKC